MTHFTGNERCSYFLMSCPFTGAVPFAFPPAGKALVLHLDHRKCKLYKPGDKIVGPLIYT
jgi:hypothetical protein